MHDAARLELVTSTAPLRTGKESILVVEDDADVRALAETMLASLGYRVLQASSGEEALAVLAKHAPDLLLTDVILPGAYNGRALAEQALKMRPSLKVVYMSGYTESAVVHHGRLDAGVQLLQKPFRKQELAEKIGAVLEQKPTARLAG
jgi:CheY-like chemotaxis protein